MSVCSTGEISEECEVFELRSRVIVEFFSIRLDRWSSSLFRLLKIQVVRRE